MTRLGASSIINVTQIDVTFLPGTRKHMNVTGRIIESLHHLNHIGASVLLSPVDPSQLQISPVDVVAVNCDGEWVDGG